MVILRRPTRTVRRTYEYYTTISTHQSDAGDSSVVVFVDLTGVATSSSEEMTVTLSPFFFLPALPEALTGDSGSKNPPSSVIGAALALALPRRGVTRAGAGDGLLFRREARVLAIESDVDACSAVDGATRGAVYDQQSTNALLLYR